MKSTRCRIKPKRSGNTAGTSHDNADHKSPAAKRMRSVRDSGKVKLTDRCEFSRHLGGARAGMQHQVLRSYAGWNTEASCFYGASHR